MDKTVKIGLKPIFLAAILLITAVFPVAAAAISPTDLGVPVPGVLPSNPFYFFKEWRRGIQRTFTFDRVEITRLDLEILNERAAEISKLVEILPGNADVLEAAAGSYLVNLKKIKPTEKLAGDIIEQHLKHIQLFAAVADAFSANDKLVQAANDVESRLAGNLNQLLAGGVSIKEFRRLLNAGLKESRQPFGGLMFAEAIDRVGDRRLIRLKEDLLIDFLGEWIAKKYPETIFDSSGDPLILLRLLDELRLKVEGRDLKNRLNIARQTLLKKIETDRWNNDKTAELLIGRAADALWLLKEPRSPAAERSVNQALFYIEQAERFRSGAQFNAAIGQAAIAVAAVQTAWLFDNPFYQDEITFLKDGYDALVGDEALEERIIGLADLVNRRRADDGDERIERLLIDIKLKLAIARHL